MKLFIATHNAGKLQEMRTLLAGLPLEISSLADYPEMRIAEESGTDFLENSFKKVRGVSLPHHYKVGDDSGLCVDALGGRPGVLSARYSGKGDDAANIAKLLFEMREVPSGKRQAHFVCALALVAPDGREWSVVESCDGEITDAPRGRGGFGYDPVFFVPEKGKTFAELSAEEKNILSHRGKAFKKVRGILRSRISGA